MARITAAIETARAAIAKAKCTDAKTRRPGQVGASLFWEAQCLPPLATRYLAKR